MFEDIVLTNCMSNQKSPVDWEVIARDHGKGRNARECHDRWTRYLKPGARKGQWREEEDAIVLRVIAQKYGVSKALIMQANKKTKDITEKDRYVRAIEEQNIKLREIAWMQSHVVRAPLARILGAVDLLLHDAQGSLPSAELLSWVDVSAREMDGVIHDIVKKATPWSAEPKGFPNNLMVS